MLITTLLDKLWQYSGGLSLENDSPARKSHYLGTKRASPVESGQAGNRRPRPVGTGNYRPLETITLGEVEDALRYLQPQLVPAPVPGWIGKNYFCQIPLNRKPEARPPVLFGRVKTCYPDEGNVQNVDDLEMYFLHRSDAPDLLRVRREDVAPNRSVDSFCVGVNVYLSDQELEDLRQAELNFLSQGFALLYHSGYLELLDYDPFRRSGYEPSVPPVLVIGSEWYASMPESIKPEIRSRLQELISQKGVILNYHAKRLQLSVPTLNYELGYKYGFTQTYLHEPENADQTLRVVSESLETIFQQPLPKYGRTASLPTASFMELKFRHEPHELTLRFLRAFRLELARQLRVPAGEIYFLGYRPGSTEVLAAMEGDLPDLPDHAPRALERFGLESIEPWVQFPEALTFVNCGDLDLQAGMEIFHCLASAHLNPWMQQESIEFGEKIPRAIRRAFENSTAFVFCFSARTSGPQRFYVWEVTQALLRADNEFPEGIYFLPVQVGPCELPPEIQEYRVLGWHESDHEEKLVRALHNGLKRRYG